jgi:ring-1,2-phenylacetyl-CoA epoxidase subunit PaaD
MVMSARLEAVRAIVAEVRDPELPSLTIQDLGILREVRLEGETVIVAITPTYSGCPAMGVIAEDIATALRTHSLESRVETVLSPAWTTDWMSEAARAKLMNAGVGAPGTRRCPNCGSKETRSLSAYGSTACQALHTCGACAETFPYFKTHR